MKFKYVFIMGLGSTGSSAVIDMLFQNSKIIGIGSDYPNETGFFDEYTTPLLYIKKYGLEELDSYGLMFLMTNSFSFLKKSHFKEQLVSRLKIIGEFKDNTKNSGVVFHLNSNLVEKLIREHLQFDDESLTSIEKYFRLLKELTIRTSDLKSKTVCFNNDLVIHKSKSKKLFSNNLKILVYRNPLDNISQLVEISKKKNIFRLIFLLRMILSRIKHYAQLLSKDLISNTYFVMLSFEDFLISREVRESISELFDGEGFLHNKVLFDVSISSLNTGIYRRNLKSYEIFIIKILTGIIYNAVRKNYSLNNAINKIRMLQNLDDIS